MFVPSLYHDNVFEDFDNLFDLMEMPTMRATRRDPLFGKRADRLMRTDVRETETGYELDIDLPGFKKEEVKAELKDGYLTISAQKSLEKKEDGKEEGRYLRRERYSGSCSRSFYVGDALTEEDVKAKFENGILQISLPKKEAAIPEKKTIMIE